ncbi:MAG: RNA methyltransferase substrate-binding domain-containing protein [Eubacterium sp.]
MRYEELTIEGRNAVLEAFRSGKTIDKIFVLEGCQDGPIKTILREAKKHRLLVKFVSKDRLDNMSEQRNTRLLVYVACIHQANCGGYSGKS